MEWSRFKAWPGYCIITLSKTLFYSHSASLQSTKVYKSVPANLNLLSNRPLSYPGRSSQPLNAKVTGLNSNLLGHMAWQQP